ncbi:MAG: M48 family metalloprotease [Bdellovibrio sp.]|nr:M48 family metalloprotease [Bdellovibrio sp.]
MKLKKLLCLSSVVFASVFAQAQHLSVTEQITTYSQASVSLHKTYLPQWIQEKAEVCAKLSSSSVPSEAQQCQADIATFAHSVLSCEHSETRLQEMTKYDDELLNGMVTADGPAQIPANIQQKFDKLVQVAMKNHRFAGLLPAWSLTAYVSKVANAHAGANGQIFVSSFFWSENAVFTPDEVVAILAHEIAHVIYRHSVKLGCMAYEWVATPGLGLKEASLYFREDFSQETERGQAWSRVSQSFELEADRGSKDLLRQAGMNPDLMEQALLKLRPKNEGFSSGSHPDFDKRVLNVHNH